MLRTHSRSGAERAYQGGATLAKVLRARKRYIAFELIGEGKRFKKSQVKQALLEELLRFLGELNFARANPELIAFDEKSNRGIIRCNREALQLVRAGLAMLSCIQEHKAGVVVLKVSGTLKKASENILNI